MKMDNILKVLLGVLGLAGLLALLTPSNINVAPEAAPETVVEAPPPSTVLAEVPPEEAFPEETDDEIVKFGEPMIDGNPIVDDETPQQQNADNPGQASANGNGNGAVDYRQILENAAQGGYGGVQLNQPPIANMPPAEVSVPTN